MSLWGRAKTLVAKNPSAAAAASGDGHDQAEQATAEHDESSKVPLNQEIVEEETKDPQSAQ